MGEEHDDRRTQFSMPVVPRVDRLDSLMKYVEGKQNPCSLSSLPTARGANNSCIPMDVALMEIQNKGTILDRLNSLENRLFQLCLEIEASNASTSSMASTSISTSSMANTSTSSRHGSSTDQSLSFRSVDERCMTYDERPNSFHRALINRFEFLGNSMSHRKDNSTQIKPLIAPKNHDEGMCKIGTKCKKSRSRRWKRLLGC